MMTDAIDLETIAKALRTAERTGIPIAPISQQHDLTIQQAYQVQLINMRRSLKQGKVITGKKIGLTSKAMQDSLKVDQPDFGFLYDSMEVEGDLIPRGAILQPRVEGELAFVLKEDLAGNVTAAQVLAATAYVVPAIEIVGSRIKDWKLTIVDTVADNASCGMYKLAERRLDPRTVNLAQVSLTLSRNGIQINQGLGAHVMGHPANAVAWLARCLGEYGVTLNRGDVVLAGALSAAVPAEPSDTFCCDFGEHGSLQIQFL